MLKITLLASTLAGVVGGAFAAVSDLPAIPVAVLAAMGGVLGTILTGKIVVPTFAYTRERDRADRYEQLLLDKVLPTSAEMVRATTDVLDYLKSRQR